MGVVGRKRVTWGSALALVLAVAGCQRAEQAGNPDAMRSLAVLGRAYGDYLASHRNVPPPDLAAFRTFATSQPAGAADYRIGDFDALLAAGRDGEPVTVVCGVKQPIVPPTGYPVAAYESVGVDGRRLVADARGGVVEMSADEFARAVPQGRP